jgi:hypothetical protein
MNNPVALALFAYQTGWVFALRSAQLCLEPAGAAAALTAMAAEKQTAFAQGAIAATAAALKGAKPEAVAAAALGPARRRVRANLKALTRPG